LIPVGHSGHDPGVTSRWAPGFLAIVLLSASGAARADLDYRIKVQAGAEVDTNAERKEGAQGGRTDGVTRLLLRGSVSHRPADRTFVDARLDFASKLFYSAASEDLFITAAALVLQHRVGDLTVGVDAFAKDRWERIADTAYFLAQGGASLRWAPGSRLSLHMRAGYGGFTFKPDDLSFGYQGDEYSVALTARPAARLRLAASYSFGRRSYRSFIFREVGGADGLQVEIDPSVVRGDQVHTANLRMRLFRRALFEGGYTFQAVLSNSFGFSYVRHRVWAQVSAKLPGAVYAHLAGAIQLLSFRDPVFLDTSLFIEDDNRNWLAVKLSREIGKGFAIEARWAFYASTFSADVLYYRRHVVGLGVAYTL